MCWVQKLPKARQPVPMFAGVVAESDAFKPALKTFLDWGPRRPRISLAKCMKCMSFRVNLFVVPSRHVSHVLPCTLGNTCQGSMRNSGLLTWTLLGLWFCGCVFASADCINTGPTSSAKIGSHPSAASASSKLNSVRRMIAVQWKSAAHCAYVIMLSGLSPCSPFAPSAVHLLTCQQKVGRYWKSG